MSIKLNNQTPLSAVAIKHRDHLLRSHVLVIAKATWRLSTGRLAPAEHQVGLHRRQCSVCLGDLDLDPVQLKALRPRLAEEIVWLDHELSPPKPMFDVIVAGYATAPLGHPHAFIDAAVRIGTHVASIRAHAPRFWHRRWLGYRAEAMAETVGRVPISYALADWASGFPIKTSSDPAELPALLPWIEFLHSSSERGRHTRVPAGLGFWPENAAHRSIHAGTYDDAWQKKRAPDLPADFNPRFYNCAHKELQLAQAPPDGTPIRLVHLAEQAIIDCAFPALTLCAQGRTAAGEIRSAQSMKPDTLVIEPDQDRMSLVYRVLLPDGEQAEAVRTVRMFKVPSPVG
ncbi:DUF2169 domain-containing protein [Massilia scottii]|uniref:DUF2169 domain-containing protein n=1 Tax=Massilia scottii TaxID=3057166 RepID=UPI0027964234|nr:DUF2169 domain-containing protein [Massilia sp. CCM 9029]MDQ1835220.1 DUF2169 domain-containing protein [Massilia sp. CCM 9029]